MTKRKTPPKRSENFVSRWGDDELDDEGYLYVPGWIMRNYHRFANKEGKQVGLTPNEFTFLCHVMCFKYDVAGSKAAPSLETLAERIGRDVSNIRNWKAGLIKKGALVVTAREGKPNEYNFGPLVKQCRKLACENTTPGNFTTPGEITSPTPGEITSPPLVISPAEESEIKSEPKSQNNAAPKKGADAPRFEPLIKAWLDTTGIIDAAAYGKKVHRDTAKAMLAAGITPQDVSEHTQEKKRDPFWQDKPIPLTEVAKTILPWKQKRAKPAVYGAEPAPTDEYYTPGAEELSHIEATKAAVLERMKANGRLTA